MSIKRAKIVPKYPALVAAFAGVGLIAAALAQLLGPRLPAVVEWPVLCVLLLAAGTVYVRSVVRRTRDFGKAASVLEEIAASGSRRSRRELLEDFSSDLVRAMDGLGKSLRTLRREKSRAEMVLANMADGIVAVDGEGVITLFNKAAEQIFGVKSQSLLGKKVETVDLHPELARLAHACIDGDSALEAEISLSGWPQRVIALRSAAFGSVDAQGDRAMIILHDISAIRQHEKNQKEFVSNVSHELRTPLTGVRTTAETLLSYGKSDEELLDRFLKTIIEESDRLSVLIDDLLEIARRDSGTIKIEKSVALLGDIVSRAISVVRPQALQKEIAVSVSAPDDMTAYCDPNQAVQLVRNLVDNAVKYTPQGGTVEVSAREADSGVSISIRDTGIGIPHGELERVFERFYRVDKARSRRLGGTGLGLAIVKDIVESHGGAIDVKTQLGKGSTFTVTLPGESGSAER